MSQCKVCLKTSPFISEALGVCLSCIREKPGDALLHVKLSVMETRTKFGLPVTPPKDANGIICNLCVNECKIPQGETGYCGLRINRDGKLGGVSSKKGKLSWYHDPLPTNCVGDWVCPGGTGAGYPAFAHSPSAESGYKNLAVFFHACSFNCIFCQNWHFKRETFSVSRQSACQVVSDVDERTSCICFFGGDPAPQLPFSLEVSKIAIQKRRKSILRICWETNGSMQEGLLDKMTEIAFHSGGCIKFDLKAWDENLHIALTGITNKRTLNNFLRASRKIKKRPEPPLIIANTLMIPGYIDEMEIKQIATYIASIDRDIPYSLLAFHPQFYMSEMPMTDRNLAHNCLEAARNAGLKNVRIGNSHLLV